MRTGRIATIVMVMAALILLLTAGSTVAGPSVQGGQGPGSINLAGNVASKISYQGRLTDAGGTPLDGTYNLVFQLWDAATAGSQIGSDIPKNNVTVSDGLFTVELEVPQDAFNGQAVWLQISVNGQVLSPRQELLSVPYALSLRPGAVISGTMQSGVLQVVNSDSSTTGGYAISAVNYSSKVWRPAIYGENKGASAGIYGRSDGWHATVGYQGSSDPSFAGVWGRNSGAGPGVYGSGTSTGVRGEALATSGVTYGGYFEASGIQGRGIYAKSYRGYAGYFECDGETGYGVYATVNGDYTSWAVRGEATGSGGGGAWFSTTAEDMSAVYGNASATGGAYNTNKGGSFVAAGNFGTGVLARADGAYGTGIVALGGTSGYAANFYGNVLITHRSTGETVMELGEGLDYAEGFDVSDKTEIGPGTVLIIDPDNPGKLAISNKPYDRKVAGIVAGAKGIGSAVRLAPGQFDYDVALAGRVYCNVDATEAGVEPGDLLTTSATPGYAMKVTDYVRAQGAILGKAMERLEKGEKGQILVLVTLQ